MPTSTSDIYELEVEESPTGTLPLYKAKHWAIGFLLFAIVLAVVFGQTMPAFFKAAYNMH